MNTNTTVENEYTNLEYHYDYKHNRKQDYITLHSPLIEYLPTAIKPISYQVTPDYLKDNFISSIEQHIPTKTLILTLHTKTEFYNIINTPNPENNATLIALTKLTFNDIHQHTTLISSNHKEIEHTTEHFRINSSIKLLALNRVKPTALYALLIKPHATQQYYNRVSDYAVN